MTRLRRALRSRPGEEGFTMVELMAAMGVMLVAVVAMMWTTMAGLRGVAVARRRQTASSLATQTVEQVRALNWATLTHGLDNTDLVNTTDSRIDKSGGPSVYKFGGEQIPHGDNPTTTPLVLHQRSVLKNNLTYTISAYLTYYQDNLSSNTYRLTVFVTWPPLRGGTGSVQTQTILYSPTGCFSTATHPFSAPCQAFLYGSASVQGGQVNMTGPITGIPLDHAALWLPSQTSGTQIEQIQAVQGSAQTSGLTLQLTGGDEQRQGRQQATSGADNDPGQPKPNYQTASTSAQAVASLVASGNGNQLTIAAGAGDTAATTSTVSANTASRPCPLLVPTSSFDLTQNDSQPCGSSKGQQGGTLSGVLSMVTGVTNADTTLASVAASPTPSGAFTNRDTAPEVTVCKLTTGDGCIESQQFRTLGTVILLQPPVGLAGFPGYDPTKGLVKLTGYADSVTAEAGKGAAAPVATIVSGTIEYYNGSGYSTMPPTATPTRIPFGLGGNGVVAGDPLAVQIAVQGDLWTGGTSVDDPAAGCTSPCTRTQASATAKSPIIGSLTYSMAYLGTNIATVTTSIDLGTLLAKTSYAAAPSGA